MAAIIDKCGTKKHYPLEIFRNGISKKTGSSVTGKMDYGIPLSSSDSAMTSKKKINRRAAFKIQIKNIVYLLKQRMIRCLILGQKIPVFILNPLKYMLNPVVDRISVQKLEYGMERDDDYNFFEIRYCSHRTFSYLHIQLEQATKLILSHFHE